MYWKTSSRRLAMVFFVATAFCFGVAPAAADKPSWAGAKQNQGKSNQKHSQKDKKAKQGAHESPKYNRNDRPFGTGERALVRDYYDTQYRKGKGCPPGLAKKHNGCRPPGQAKKQWHYGAPLPRDVVYHDLPRKLIIELPLPPDGARYVRVLSDILLIGIGTGIVIDAIEDLGRL